jgi:nucleotide-binding universal stress UspA family protein
MSYISRVIVGVDGSDNSEVAAAYAADLAISLGASVVAVHAIGLLDRMSPSSQPLPADQHRNEIEARFTREWTAPLSGLTVDRRLVDGTPATALLRIADQHGDVIVVGRRGRGDVNDLSLGSTSSQIANQSRVPVLVVPLHA